MAGVYQQAVVEFPNGEKHTFVPKDSSLPYYRLASVRDSFGNGFDIAYAANVWTITDTLGRQHKAFFDYVHPVLGRQLTQLQLAGFNGTQAVFTFSYAVPPYQEPGGTATGFLARSTKHQYNCSVCWKNQALPPPWVQVAFLTKVTLPDGSAFGLGDGENLGDYYALIPPSCTPPSLPAPDYPGVLKKLRLPTGGTYTWTWGKWQNAPGNVSCYNHAEELALVQDLLGVVRKDIANPMPGGTQAGSWLYQHTVPCTLSDGQPDPDCQESWTAVTDPLGNVTKHYFRTRYCLQSPDYGWDYGLPYTMGPQGQSTSPPFKSVEYYRGATTLLRTAYVTYEHDALVPIQDAQYLPWKWHDSNRRVKFEQTTYADDGGRIATVSYSNFDGLGHYRQVQTGGSFPGNNVRTTFVNYNPTRGVYPGSFVPPSPNDPWVLGTFSYRQQTEGSFQQFEQSCFEASTGFLLRSRTYKNPPYQASADVIVRFSRDTAGNTVREERFGGDLQAVPTGDLCSLALPTAWYRVDHSYQYGVRNQSVVVDAATGVAFPFKLLDQDIDFATGLVKTSRDVSGLATTYEYDAMARVSWVKPQLGHDGWVRFVYTNASATTPAKVDVYVLPNGSTNLSQALARMAWEFDGFGRPYGEYRRMPGGTWVQRKTNYNALGWTVKSSEWDPYGTPDSGPNGMKWTETTSFDPFGRPERVVAPDGKVTTFSYAGVRLTTVQATVATQANGVETTATVTREFDRFGRLVKVTEPSGSGGSMVSTSYVYDVAGRLRQATTAAGAITQNRVWTYDGRGYLQAEQLPEKGPSGNGVVQYLGYDALGHATRVV
ncbi:RHS repeat domain-containing protein, partial [Thermoanaerobaculum aquaticum]|uniref:RHS repeat domain-containing protein n=1 Tax=Thermoanaerobaculum aquaticum TaxID=1312852 RepID=UPI00056E0FA6